LSLTALGAPPADATNRVADDAEAAALGRRFLFDARFSSNGQAPYMHAGQMRTLAEVLDHYNRAPAATTGTSELEPLGLSVAELRELTAFLGALGSDPVD
jgi:cytochrome c peroxidase